MTVVIALGGMLKTWVILLTNRCLVLRRSRLVSVTTRSFLIILISIGLFGGNRVVTCRVYRLNLVMLPCVRLKIRVVRCLLVWGTPKTW